MKAIFEKSVPFAIHLMVKSLCQDIYNMHDLKSKYYEYGWKYKFKEIGYDSGFGGSHVWIAAENDGNERSVFIAELVDDL